MDPFNPFTSKSSISAYHHNPTPVGVAIIYENKMIGFLYHRLT
jgi:hypothetical protein